MDAYETSLYYAVLMTALLLGTVIIFFVTSIIKTQKKYFQIRRNQMLTEIRMLEDERNRIARDLHDELGPILSITRKQVNRLQTDQTALKQQVNENLDNVIAGLREISRNLMPERLVKKGLRFMIQEFIGQYHENTNIMFDFSYHVSSRLPDRYMIHMYRIVQELVQNTSKHSNARRIHVHFKELKNRLYIEYKDDGGGKEITTDSGGLGLKNLQNRTLLLGGTIEMDYTTEGISYFFRIPIKKNDEEDQSNAG